jgi:peptide/nickel transport system ATP-binding protein
MTPATLATTLQVDGLTVRTDAGLDVVSDVSLALSGGEVLGLAGESGSGKSTLALALLGYARPGLHIAGGRVVVDGTDVLSLRDSERRAIRGRRVAYVSQDANKSLNPSIRIGDLVREVMQVHGTGSSDADVQAALGRVLLPTDRQFRRRYAHQLSGGQQQRLAIGIALACQPSVLVLDEPTTGLDVVTQAMVLAEIARICRDERVASIFVSHDLAAMSTVATRIAVLYAGRVVEIDAAADLLAEPKHPYTSGLLESIPIHSRPSVLTGIPGIPVGLADRPPGCAFAPRCPLHTPVCDEQMPELLPVGVDHLARCIHWDETPRPVRSARSVRPSADQPPLLSVRSLRAVHRSGSREVVAADDVSFDVAPGERVALVGESGSGKSTIARCIAGLHRPAGGQIVLGDRVLSGHSRGRDRSQRQRLQIVFQNPYDSLNPRRTVEESITRPLHMFFGFGRRQARERVAELMSQVQLSPSLARRYPRELSGGERQRVAIARALAAGPDLLICDEVTSSLDVSVQATVLDLLARLDIALLFITHDLGVVASIADRVLVLERGVVREEGDADTVLRAPAHPYTRQLIDSIPALPILEDHVR